jgi:hypothetical protein
MRAIIAPRRVNEEGEIRMVRYDRERARTLPNRWGRALAQTWSHSALCVIAVGFLLAGCASTPKLDTGNHLVAARIDPAVATTKEMYYLGPGSGVGMMFGAIGGAITAVANIKPGEQLNKFAQDNGIHIDEIVRDEATQAFRQSGKFDLTDAQGPNVDTLKISVPMYGFSIPTGFSGDLVPVIKIECSLVDSSGKIIWSANDSVLPLGNPAEGKTPDEFRADPKLIEQSWRVAARSIMTNITKHM